MEGEGERRVDLNRITLPHMDGVKNDNTHHRFKGIGGRDLTVEWRPREVQKEYTMQRCFILH